MLLEHVPEAIDGICEGLLGEELVYVAEERETEARTWKPKPGQVGGKGLLLNLFQYMCLVENISVVSLFYCILFWIMCS